MPLERTTSYEHGTRNGPAAILAASRNMELYDEELELEPYKEIGIHTLPAIDTADGTLDEVITEIFTAQMGLLDDDKFTVALGGEHSLTPPLVSATAKKFKNLSVLQIDAHADLRDEYQGNPASHACAMRRVVEVCPRRAGWHSLALRGRSAGDSPSAHQRLLGKGYRARSHEELDRKGSRRPQPECVPHY